MVRKEGVPLHFSKSPFPHPPPHSAPAAVQEGAASSPLQLKSPGPFLQLWGFFFPLFGSENDFGYQTASGFGLWNAFVFQKGKKLPRITKRQVRTMAFRKKPHYSALHGLWRGKNN